MDPLLIGAAGFLLESIASLGLDIGKDFLLEKLSNKTLLNADDRVREYLLDHLHEHEYEEIVQKDEFYIIKLSIIENKAELSIKKLRISSVV